MSARVLRPARSGRANGKRERILDAAAALFAGRELSRVTMEEVAARARVAKGTLYNHFQSKEDLYFSIITARMGGLLEALRALFAEEESASVRLRKIVVHLLMFLVKYPDFFRILRKERSCPALGAPREIEDLRRDLRGLLRDVLARGVQEGAFRPIEPDFAADVILGSIEGAALRWVEEGRRPARGGPEPEALFEFVRHSLSSGSPPEAGPLAGRRVLVTREEGPGGALSRAIESLGGEAVQCPLVRTAPPADPEPLRRAASEAARYDWILFTSARGVDAFAAAREGNGPLPATTCLGAVGPATARRTAERFGRIDLVSEESTGAGLAAALSALGSLEGKKVLLPRAEEGAEDLPAALRAAGACVEDRIAYRTVAEPGDLRSVIERLHSGAIDAVVFASPSAAKAFAERIGAGVIGSGPDRIRVVSIGPTTSGALRALGMVPDAEAVTQSMDALAAACIPPTIPSKPEPPPIGAGP
jgi:uroporphyrinogen-III synthase/AcrR family transcriptional regulator